MDINPQLEPKHLFEFIINERYNTKYSLDTIHNTWRLVSMISELSNLVSIRTSPEKSTKDLVDYLQESFQNHGIKDEQIYIHQYEQTLDGKTINQYNLVVLFPPLEENYESVVISGHLDTVPIDFSKFSSISL